MKYTMNAPIAIAGLRLNSTPEDIRSLAMQGTGKALDGQAVAINKDGDTCKVVASGDTDFGIVVFQHTGKRGRSDDGKQEAYIQYDVVPVMTKGRIWVRPAETIAARGKAAKVYVTPTGGLSAVAASNFELVGAFWDVPSNADGLAVVDLG